MANWTTINSGGGGISVAAAPNVLGSTSVMVLYSCPGNDSMYQLQASIAIDLANGNIDHLKQIHIGNTLTGQAFTSNPVLRPATGWTSPVVITGDAQPRTGADQPGTLTFVCVNDLNDQTAGAVTKSFTVDASKVNSFASQGETGSRTCDINRVVYFTASFVPVINGPHYPENVSYAWFDGTSWTYYGWQKMLLAGQSFTIGRPVPAATQTGWKFAARAGAFQWTGAITQQQLTDNGFLIAPGTFTVNGLAAPAANCVTNIVMGTITAMKNITSGWQWPEFSGVSWTDPTDVNCWLVKFYVRETDSLGSPAGDASGQWREWIEKQVLGTAGGSARVSDPGPWPKGDALAINYRAAVDTHHWLEIQCVAVNRLSTSPADWNGADTASSVAQGARARLDFGALPSGAIPLNMADPNTSLLGTLVTDVPAPPAGAGFALTITIVAGPATSGATETYGWTGIVTPPTDRTNYYGVVLTQQWHGKNEGGAFCTLLANGSTPVNFNSDNYYPRGAGATQCTFRAYPISRDGVRGTPVIANGAETTIPASGTYIPPSGPTPAGSMTITSAVAYDTSVPSAPTITVSGTVSFGGVTNYAGCDLTLLWDGQTTEIPGGHLDAATTVYRFPAWAQKGTSDGVIVKCYPTNSNGVRGAGIAATRLAISAAASYVSPPIPAPAAMTSVSFWITAGPPASGNVETYGWMGSIVRPSDLTNYNGCQLTQQWDNGAEGGTFQTLSPTQVNFQSDLFYPRGSGTHTLVIRAYPISPSGIRGTPAFFSSNVAPASRYTPPTGGGIVASNNFEDGTLGDWGFTGIGRFGLTSSSPISGGYSLQINAGGTTEYFSRVVWCKEGAAFSASAKYKSTVGASGVYIAITFYDGSWGNLGANQVSLAASTSVAGVAIGPFMAPANAAAAAIVFQSNLGGAGTFWVDDIELRSTGGTGVILNPCSGLPTSSNINGQASIMHDWDFNLSPVGPLFMAGPVWRTYGDVQVRDDGDGLLHYCRITDASASGSGLIQLVPCTGGQQIKLFFRTRNNSSTAKLWIGISWLNRNNPDPPWVNYYQSSINGSLAAWASSPNIAAIAPAGTAYACIRLEMIEGTPTGQYYDVGRIVMQVVPW